MLATNAAMEFPISSPPEGCRAFCYRADFRALGTAQVDARTMNSGSIIIRRLASRSVAEVMLRKTVSAASRPIRRNGWRTVVKPGFWKAAL